MPIILGSIVRHILTLFAGGLLTVGVSEAESAGLARAAEPVVTGALIYGAAQVWSIFDKKKR